MDVIVCRAMARHKMYRNSAVLRHVFGGNQQNARPPKQLSCYEVSRRSSGRMNTSTKIPFRRPGKVVGRVYIWNHPGILVLGEKMKQSATEYLGTLDWLAGAQRTQVETQEFNRAPPPPSLRARPPKAKFNV